MNKNDQFDLDKHLKDEHKQSPLAEYLKEIVYGGNDGIVTTFAVVAGFSGASITGNEVVTLSFATVLLFGFANLLADAVSMGLGNFLSIRAEKDVYESQKTKEYYEIENNSEMETLESESLLIEKGFSKEDSKTMVVILKKNKEYWADWMMKYELEMADPATVNPFLTAFATFISFIIFGAIPLIPFVIFSSNPSQTFIISSFATLFALVMLGVLRWKVIGIKPLKSIMEIVLIGGISAVVAFAVGVLFKG